MQFIIALRLQYGIKLAGVDQAAGVPHLTEAITNLPSGDLYFGPYTYEYPSGGGTIIRGMYERTYANFVPNVIMKRMNLGTNTYEPVIDDPETAGHRPADDVQQQPGLLRHINGF